MNFITKNNITKNVLWEQPHLSKRSAQETTLYVPLNSGSPHVKMGWVFGSVLDTPRYAYKKILFDFSSVLNDSFTHHLNQSLVVLENGKTAFRSFSEQIAPTQQGLALYGDMKATFQIGLVAKDTARFRRQVAETINAFFQIGDDDFSGYMVDYDFKQTVAFLHPWDVRLRWSNPDIDKNRAIDHQEAFASIMINADGINRPVDEIKSALERKNQLFMVLKTSPNRGGWCVEVKRTASYEEITN